MLNFGNTANLLGIDFATGTNNTPGVSQYAYYAKLDDIDILPHADVTDPNQQAPYELEALVTVTSNIVMKPGKSFVPLYCTLEEGELKSSLQGLRDSKSFKQQFETYFPGSKERYHGFRTWVKNGAGIFIIPDMDGNKYILGSKCYPANLTGGEWTTAKKGDERKGGSLIFDFNSAASLLFFKGNVMLVDLNTSSQSPQTLVYCG